MQQMIDEAGNIWNVDPQGNPVFVGNANQQSGGMQIKPADPARQYDVQIKQQQVAKGQQEMANAPLQQQLLRAQIAKAQADAQKAQAGTAGAATGDAKLVQRTANLRALQQNIARVRELYEANLKGGFPNQANALVPDFVNPTLGQFDSAGAGLGETGLAAFRVPGVGAQSDNELRAFVDANKPTSTDNDLRIEEKLRNLETRLNATLQEMGVETPTAAGPTVLPQAAGTQQAATLAQSGEVTSKGGLEPIPELAGYENQVIDMIGRGASSQQVVGFMNEQLGKYNARVGTPLAAWIDGIVKKHRANPRQPVRSLGQGWEMLYHRDAPVRQDNSFLGIDPDSTGGTTAMTAANAATAGLPAYLAGKEDVMAAAANERPGPAITGEIVGGAAGMLGINKAAGMLGRGGALLTRGGGIGGDMLYGATRGGLEGGPGGAIAGALAGGAGNKIGGGIASGTGAMVRGVRSPAVRYLADKGIPMTMGQMLGNRGMVGRTMNKLESVPFLGDALQNRRMEGVKAFNEEAFKQAVDPINGPAPGFGPDGIDAAQQSVRQAYDDAYGGVNLIPDEQFAQQAAPFIEQGRAVPVMGEQFDYIMQNQVRPLGEGGALDGPRLQAALQALKGARSDFAREGAMGNAAANAVSGVEGAFNDLVARQAPDVLPKIGAANAANRNVSTLGDAVTADAGGMFTPAQLRRAGINNTKKFGGRNAAARGDIPFKELVGYGQDVLPSTIPNSGTADRGMAAALLPAALGGGAIGAQQLGEPKVAIPLGVLAALSSKQGSKIAQKVLTGRGSTARALGVAIRKQKRKAGLFGAAAGVSMLPNSSQ